MLTKVCWLIYVKSKIRLHLVQLMILKLLLLMEYCDIYVNLCVRGYEDVVCVY